jgi:hypothetical protein
MLIYADDIILLAYNPFDLQDKINVLKKYFEDNDLIVNLGKTKIVIFRNGNYKFNKPKIFWGEQEVEFVESYTYLGVPLYGNMNYGQTCNDFIQKAKGAQTQLFSLFYKSRIKTLDSRLRLFQALTKSVLMYCSHLWGIDFCHRLVVFEINFLRYLFGVPKHTSQWFLRLETQINSIEATLIKNALYFWFKILQKPKQSLLRNCLHGLVQQVSSDKFKFNWFRSLKLCLAKYDCDKMLISDPEPNDLENIGKLALEINKTINTINNKIREQNIVSMQNSTTMANYQTIRTHCRIESFLNTKLDWSFVKLMVQMRANLSCYTIFKRTVKLNTLENFYNNNIDRQCKLCNLEKPENLYHVLFECPYYMYIRRIHFKKYVIPKETERFVMFFQEIDEEKMKCVMHYTKQITETRDIYLSP